MPIFYFRWYGLRQKDGWIIVIITKITIIIITYAFLSCREIVTSEIVHVILSLFSDWSSMWTFRTACLWLLIFVVGSSDSCSMCLFIKMPHLGILQCCAYHLVIICCFFGWIYCIATFIFLLHYNDVVLCFSLPGSIHHCNNAARCWNTNDGTSPSYTVHGAAEAEVNLHRQVSALKFLCSG